MNPVDVFSDSALVPCLQTRQQPLPYSGLSPLQPGILTQPFKKNTCKVMPSSRACSEQYALLQTLFALYEKLRGYKTKTLCAIAK